MNTIAAATPGDRSRMRGFKAPKVVHFKTAPSFNITCFFMKKKPLIFSPFSAFFLLASLVPAWKRQQPIGDRKAKPQKDLTTSETATVSSSPETHTAPNLQH